MKKSTILKLSACLFASAVSVQAAVVFTEDFSGYSDGDINGVNGWVASTNGKLNQVTSGELKLAPSGDRVMFSGAGTSLAYGESVRLTVDYRVAVTSERRHSALVGFGIQTNGIATAASNASLINNYMFIFGLEPSGRTTGDVTFMADQQQWTGGGAFDLKGEVLGMNPYGWNGTNDVPALIDAESDLLRAVYTITKSHISNEFIVATSVSNLASTVYEELTGVSVVRPDVWASGNIYFTMHSATESNTNFIQKVTMEKLDASVVPPSQVSTLGLDGEVSLSWNVVPGATQYKVYRTLTPGNYTGVTPVTVSTESYSDTSVVNGTTYYYSVVSVIGGVDSALSTEQSATPQTIYSNQAVYFTDFSTIALGDLANDADWGAISGSSNNAFEVIDDGGTKKADSIVTSNDFSNVVGNGVFVNRLMGNEQDDAIEGYFDVVVTLTAAPGLDADQGNNGVMSFGISSSSAEALNVTKNMMALFYLGVRAENNIYVTFTGTYDNDADNNRLALMNYSDLGWNPKPIEAATKSWLGNPGAPQDLITDPIRVSWKIRKTREEGVYQAWASMSNLVSGAVSDGNPIEIEFDTVSKSTMYDATASMFVMDHSYKAKADGQFSTLFATVEEVSLSHSTGNLPVAKDPVLTDVIKGDRSVSFSWEDILEANGYTIEMEDPDGVTYLLADNTNVTTFTDSPRWNDIANTYTLTANFDVDVTPSTTSTNFDAAPIGLVPVFGITSGYGTSSKNLVPICTTNSGGTLRYYGGLDQILYENGVGGYAGPTIYGLVQQTPFNGTVQYKLESASNKIAVNSGGVWNDFANGLLFIPVSEMGYETSTLDAYNNAPLTTYVKYGSWTWGAGGNIHAAIRNGNKWYVSWDTKYASNYIDGGTEKPIFIPNVINETWRELSVDPETAMAPSATVADPTSLTNITAMGWFFNKCANASVYEMEVKISGALPSYDWWAQDQGLVGGDAGEGEDPDGDGIINKLEYAYGGDPNIANTATLPVMDMTVVSNPSNATDSITYVYQKRRDPQAGITYTMETTGDLVNGPWSAAAHTAVESVLDYEWTVVTNYVPVSAPQTFIKVNVD